MASAARPSALSAALAPLPCPPSPDAPPSLLSHLAVTAPILPPSPRDSHSGFFSDSEAEARDKAEALLESQTKLLNAEAEIKGWVARQELLLGELDSERSA